VKTAVIHAALQAAEAMGENISQKALARDLEVSPSTVAEAVRDLRSARNEDLGQISFTKAQDRHVGARLRMLAKKLEADFDERVRLAMLEKNKDYLTALEKLEKQANEKLELYETLVNRHQPIFTVEEYKNLLMVAHPDANPSKETCHAVFLSLKAMELQLIGRKL
jgi:hypothetical protein